MSSTARRILRWTGKTLLWLAVALLVLAVSGTIYQAIATERAYPPPGEMVGVRGYSLHIDRAGMGWSEMGPEPRDARRISGELHALLEGASIEGPYVPVGHSFGGLYMQTYAARYPDEVAGVSLVESSHPEEFSYRPVTRDSYEPQQQIFAVSSLLARIGVFRLLFKLVPAPAELPQQQRAQIDALSPSTRQVSTTSLELRATRQTVTQTRSLRSLGDKPLAVVSAGTQEPEWLELQDDLATLSSNSTHTVVKGATHTSVLYDRSQAQATSAAIVEVVKAARNDQALPGTQDHISEK